MIAIDGKTLRHLCDRGGGKKAIHMVSAWATSQRLVGSPGYWMISETDKSTGKGFSL